jgi:aspartyl/asparaginyl beta-hydroxylase (cupin superfamily)
MLEHSRGAANLARRADAARKVLNRFGIDMDDPANGVFLPPAQHVRLHTNEYYDAVNQELAAASTKAEAEDILRSIARRLAEGKFP